MSISYHVHAKSDRGIGVADLAFGLRQFGWTAVCLRDFKRFKTYEIASVGAVQDCDVICGWRTDEPSPEALHDAVRNRAADTLTAAANEGRLVTFAVYLERPPETLEQEDLDELIEERGRDFADAVKNAVAAYEVSTSAGRTQASHEFQLVSSLVIARLCDGMWDDEMDATSQSIPVGPVDEEWGKSVAGLIRSRA